MKILHPYPYWLKVPPWFALGSEAMFEAVIERASLLKKIIDAVKELSKEVSLVCDEKGIKLRVMDSSHVSLTDLHMAEAAFLDYRCDSRKVLGMNLEHMKKIFTLCNNEDKVTMKCEDDGSHLLFTFEALDERVSWARISDLRILKFEEDFRRGSKMSKFPTARQNHFQTLRVSFSAVSTPILQANTP